MWACAVPLIRQSLLLYDIHMISPTYLLLGGYLTQCSLTVQYAFRQQFVMSSNSEIFEFSENSKFSILPAKQS